MVVTKSTYIFMANKLGTPTIHYCASRKTKTLCKLDVAHYGWFTCYYSMLKDALGTIENPFKRQEHECAECFNAIHQLKIDTNTEQEVQFNKRYTDKIANQGHT